MRIVFTVSYFIILSILPVRSLTSSHHTAEKRCVTPESGALGRASIAGAWLWARSHSCSARHFLPYEMGSSWLLPGGALRQLDVRVCVECHRQRQAGQRQMAGSRRAAVPERLSLSFLLSVLGSPPPPLLQWPDALPSGCFGFFSGFSTQSRPP